VNNLQEATEKICELKGNVLALDAVVATLIAGLSGPQQAALAQAFEQHSEVARAVLLNAPISEHTLAAYEHDVRRYAALFTPKARAGGPAR
jgi:hypothetical protein